MDAGTHFLGSNLVHQIPNLQTSPRQMERSRRNHRQFKRQIPNPPQDIIEQILSRLPVKSLLKFRCVSKPWCNSIGSKNFIKTHLQNSTYNTDFTHHKIVSTCHQPYFNLKHCSLHSLFHKPITSADELSCPIEHPNEPFRVVGCCNGLICVLVNRKQLFLWNPSTRKSRILPKIYDKMKPDLSVFRFGFGYDESNDDYKVVGLLDVPNGAGGLDCIVKIYSLKTNSWKETTGFLIGFQLTGPAKFVCGKLHWGKWLNSKWYIVSFELKNEVWANVEQPRYVEEVEADVDRKLEVIRGCLTLFCVYRKIRLDIWVLKEYGVKESWDRVANVPYYFFDPSTRPSVSMPFWIGSNGEVLFLCSSTFVIYNPEDNSSRQPRIVDFGEFFYTNVYVESLVSLTRS